MCLVAIAVNHHRRFPLIIAANRDEFHDRAAAALDWWTPQADGSPVLSGRDLQAGGTWLGLNAAGRLALVTNIRRPGEQDPAAPSRGQIVPQWLRGDQRPDRFWMRTALSGYNPFNVLLADLTHGQVFHASSDQPAPQTVGRGLWGLSNGGFDEPWPKVTALKARVAEALRMAPSSDSLAARLLAALADANPADDDSLPETGVPLAWERLLSSAFIRAPGRGYGTRCSTVLITEKVRRRLVTHVFERRFDAQGDAVGLRRTVLRNWPPAPGSTETTTVAAVSDARLAETALTAVRRQRKRAPSSAALAGTRSTAHASAAAPTNGPLA